MKRILLSAFFIPFILLLGSQNDLLKAQTPGDSVIIDTAEIIQYTLFPEVDPFESSEPIRMTLEFDMRQLNRKKNEEEYQDAVLRWEELDGDSAVHNLKIKARGEFRKAHCRFHPSP